MRLYLIPVMGMCLGVDGLLLMASKHLGGGDDRGGGIFFGSLLGALYAGWCVVYSQLGNNILLRMVVLGIVGLIAFGRHNLRCVILYMVLSLSVGGVAVGNAGMGLLGLAAFLLLLCLGGPQKGRTVPVTLRYADQTVNVDALYDSGNLLRDPITGERVLVAGELVAGALLGLKKHQLADPVTTVREQPVPGLRLLPFHSVGGGGFMLAVRVMGARKGEVEKRILVAFAPSGLEKTGNYHALTGGAI